MVVILRNNMLSYMSCITFFFGLTVSNYHFLFRFDTEHSQDDEVHVESFCVITAGIQVWNKTNKQTNK